MTESAFTKRIGPLMLLLGCLIGCGPGDDAASGDEEQADLAPAVEALPARRGTLPLEERLNGVVRADNQVAVRPEIEAPIVEVLVRNGEAVASGQPLVRLQNDTLREQLRQAEASVRLAEASARQARARVAEVDASARRIRELARQELVSALEAETQEARLTAARAGAAQAQAAVDEARATAEERRAALDRAVVRAPVAGRVGQRNAEVGMLAGADDVLFVLGDLRDLIVEVPLTEEMLQHVRTGQTVRISGPSLRGSPLSATLSRISPFLEENSFSTVGEIDVDNSGKDGTDGRLHPGMFVTVDVLYGQSAEATLVPASALWEDPRTGLRGVYVLKGPPGQTPGATTGVALRPVEVLAEGRGLAGVREIREGEWVVTVGQHLLAEDRAESARVRPTTWERVLQLQGLQREVLLQSFLDKQQRWARERGTEPPTKEEFLGQTDPERKGS
jgi:HlyD family secretion protein